MQLCKVGQFGYVLHLYGATFVARNFLLLSQVCQVLSTKFWCALQTENLNGPLASVDDVSETNLWKLMATAKNLLDEPVTERDFQTGKLTNVPYGGTNREALYR